jgi:hypothetical protein
MRVLSKIGPPLLSIALISIFTSSFAFAQCGGGCSGCVYGYCIDGQCTDTPIIIDTTGAGFSLTAPQDGAWFNLSDSGPNLYSWTEPGSTNAFLVLDRNGNGAIDNGSELFGDQTDQPGTINRNGFAALALFDDPINGGNGDGLITKEDQIYSKLRLWRDLNHDGVSQPNELFTLEELGIESISLSYQELRRKDRYGNEFRYRARVGIKNAPNSDRWAYDVILNPAKPLTTP